VREIRERSVEARGGAGRGVWQERWRGTSNDTGRAKVREEQQREGDEGGTGLWVQ